MRLFLLSLISVALISCSSESNPSGKSEAAADLHSGVWRFAIKNEFAEIPFLAELKLEEKPTFRILNGDEETLEAKVELNSNTIRIQLPVFAAELHGKIESPELITGEFIRTDESDYRLPFVAEGGKDFLFTNAKTSLDAAGKYQVTFRPDSPNPYPAILLLEQDKDNHLRGTFLTETGDYRYLSGNIMNSEIHLSGFSGATLYYFVADISGDSLSNGIFYSGKKAKRTWEGVINPDFELADATTLTSLKEEAGKFDFNLINQNGEPVTLADLKPANTVAIVEIMGSWCPNCMDAAVSLKKFKEEFEDDLVVIPVAFENTADLSVAKPRLEKMQRDLDISGQFVFGGIASSENVLEKLPALKEFRSYPTLIFLDKKDSVRSIYTGFYGPGTGKYYDNFMAQTDSLLQQLTSE